LAILEVGENHKFKKISKAISESSDQDTIQIYWGKYTESFDCNKKLNIVGVPEDPKDFSTYPIIFTKENEVINFTAESRISNIIFITQSKDLNCKINENELNTLFIKKKIEKERLKNLLSNMKNQETSIIVDSCGCEFLNCYFIGFGKTAVTVNLNSYNQQSQFSYCGFFFGSVGFSVWGKTKTKVCVQKCNFSYNMIGIKGSCFYVNKSKFFENYISGITFSGKSENTIENSKIHKNATGIIGEEKGCLSISNTKINNNTFAGINLNEKSKLFLNKCDISKNADGIILSQKTNLMAVESDFCKNNGDGIFCINNAKITLKTCLLLENKDKGIELQNKSKAFVLQTRIVSNRDVGFFASHSACAKLYESDCIDNFVEVKVLNKATVDLKKNT